jgi:hypothetical protein
MLSRKVLSNVPGTDQRGFPGRRLVQVSAGDVWAERIYLDTDTLALCQLVRNFLQRASL